MTDADLTAFIAGMPKAELHLHLEGTLEPELKFELAARNGVDLPYRSVDEMRAAYDFDDLPSFLAVYYEGMSVLLTEQDFYDLAIAYFRKAALAERRLRRGASSTRRRTRPRGIPFATVDRGLPPRPGGRRRRARPREPADHVLPARPDAPSRRCATLEESLPYSDWIVGVGLDSDEQGNPPVKFADVFARARDEGYRLTMHCDVDQEDSVGHIWQCLDEIGVERIDHGVNSLEDPALVREIGRRGLGLTVCPISNGYVAGGLKARELKTMLDHGMRATVNSDDPAYFPGYVNENLAAAQAEAGDDARGGRPARAQLVRDRLARRARARGLPRPARRLRRRLTAPNGPHRRPEAPRPGGARQLSTPRGGPKPGV